MSQTLLNPPPTGARGVRRLNRWPAFAGLVVVIIILIVIAYTFRERMLQQDRERAQADATDVGGAGKRAKNLFPDQADKPPPPANSEPPPKEQQQKPPQPPVDLAEVSRQKAWMTYYEKSAAHADMVNDRQGKALAAPTNDGGATQVSQTATPAPDTSVPGLTQPSGGYTGLPPSLSGGLGGLPGMPSLPGQNPDGSTQLAAQGQKRDFLNQGGDVLGRDEDLRGSVHGPKWDTIMEGTAIPGVMIGGLTSDMPGMVVAMVTQNIYDTAGMLPADKPLIPQGTKLVGRYDNSISYGQQRVGVIWNRMIFPDSSSRQLGSMQGADSSGYAGFYDIVNTHFWDKFWAATIISIAGAAAQLSQPQQSAFQGYSPSSVAAGAMTQGYSQLGEAYARAGLTIPNTLEIRPGYNFVFMVNKDMKLPVYVDHRNGGGQQFGVIVR